MSTTCDLPPVVVAPAAGAPALGPDGLVTQFLAEGETFGPSRTLHPWARKSPSQRTIHYDHLSKNPELADAGRPLAQGSETRARRADQKGNRALRRDAQHDRKRSPRPAPYDGAVIEAAAHQDPGGAWLWSAQPTTAVDGRSAVVRFANQQPPVVTRGRHDLPPIVVAPSAGASRASEPSTSQEQRGQASTGPVMAPATLVCRLEALARSEHCFQAWLLNGSLCPVTARTMKSQRSCFWPFHGFSSRNDYAGAD
jgi:hypothetical protein